VQADSTLPIEHRRNYKSVVDALVRCVAGWLAFSLPLNTAA
jgi:hypothetical protein